ncbi:MAG TPA: AbrB/MazE/SpoVT family DNA-binding domain-containing protein [Clostridia bacterium]|nr:AbrB/MazE/SpoVT family DNA-binding domain-containing protein [Clostridia bacterium]
MNETGIVRRIDELGRIVVPKEIRSSMRLAEGSMLEFCVSGDNLVLKKYNQLSVVNETVYALAKTLSSRLDTAVYFVSDGEIFAESGKEELDQENFDPEKRVQYNASIQTKSGRKNGIVTPIISGGDLVGNIVVLDESQTAKELSNFAADLVASYYEN